jgi:hypothetical protein
MAKSRKVRLARHVAGMGETRDAGSLPGSVRVGFVMDKVALGQVSHQVLRFYPVSIIPPWLSILMYQPGMNNGPFGGRSSETQSHPIEMNTSNSQQQAITDIISSVNLHQSNRIASL